VVPVHLPHLSVCNVVSAIWAACSLI
jgi:hypothetical protein